MFDNMSVDEDFIRAYGKALDEYADKYEKLGKEADTAAIGIDDFNQEQIKAGKQAVKTTTIWQDIGNGIKSLGKTIGSMTLNAGLDILISSGLQLAINGISDFIHREEIAIDTGKQAQQTISDTFNEFTTGKTTLNSLGQSFSDSTDSIVSTGDAIDSVAKKYTELAKGVDANTNENIRLSDEDYKTYLDLSNQLASLYPQLQSSTDSQGNAILNLGSNAQTAANSIRELYNAAMLTSNVNIGAQLQDSFKGVATQIKQYQDQIKDYEQEAAFARDREANISSDVFDKISKGLDDSLKIEFDSRQLGDEYAEYYNSVLDALEKSGINNIDLGGSNEIQIDPDTGEQYQSAWIDIREATSEQLDQFKAYMSTASNETKDIFAVQVAENEKLAASTQLLIEDQWKGMTDSLGQYLQTTETFDNLDSSIQTALLKNLPELDISTLSDNYDGDVMRFMYDQFLTPLSELKPEAQEALADVLSLDSDTLSTLDYYSQVQDAIQKAFPDNPELQRSWLDKLGLQDTINENALKVQQLTDQYKGFEDQINDLTGEDREIAYDIIINDDDVPATFDGLLARIEETKNAFSSEGALSSLQSTVDSITDSYSTMSSAISESISETGLTADTITGIKSSLEPVLAEFDSLSDYDLNSLFTNTAEGVKLNSDRMEDLLNLQHQMRVKDFASTINDQTDAVKKYEDALKDVVKGTEEYDLANQDYLNAKDQLAAMEQARAQYHAMYQQQKELFSDYADWERATQTANAGDQYNTLRESLESYKEMYDQGLIGTDDFKTFAKLLSPSGATDELNFAENYGKAQRYLTEDNSGLINFFEDLSTVTDAAGQKMAQFNEETGQWELNVHDLGEIAQKVGIGEPIIEALFGRAEDYGATSTVIEDMEDGILKYTEASQNYADAQARLHMMEEANKETPGLYNETALEGARQDVERYAAQMDGLTESMQYYQDHVDELGASDVTEATEAIKSLNEERQALLEQANGDTESVAYKQAQALERAIKEQAESSNLELDAELNVTGVKESSLDSLQGLQDEGVISAEIDLDYDRSMMSIDEIDAKIQELNGEKARIEVEADTPEAQAAIEQINSEVQALENQKISIKIQAALDQGYSVNELLAMDSQELQATLNIDASQVESVRDLLESLQGQTVEASIKLDQTQFTSLIDAISGEPVEIPVEADTSGVQAEVEQSVSGAKPKVTPEIDGALETNETVKIRGIVEPLDTTNLHQPEVALVGKVVQLDTEGVSSDPVELTGKIKANLDTSGLHQEQVAIVGQIVQVTGNPQTPVNVNGNLQSVNTDGVETPNVDVTGTLTSVDPNGQTVEVSAHATLSGGVSGADGQNVNVNATASGQEQVTALKGAIDTVEGKEVDVVANVYGTDDVHALKAAIDSVYSKAVTVGASTYGTDGVNSLAAAINAVQSKSVTITANYVTNGSPAQNVYTGTVTSIAHADGTAYNVLNTTPISPAHARGDITLPKNEKALVNEIGMKNAAILFYIENLSNAGNSLEPYMLQRNHEIRICVNA